MKNFIHEVAAYLSPHEQVCLPHAALETGTHVQLKMVSIKPKMYEYM